MHIDDSHKIRWKFSKIGVSPAMEVRPSLRLSIEIYDFFGVALFQETPR